MKWLMLNYNWNCIDTRLFLRNLKIIRNQTHKNWIEMIIFLINFEKKIEMLVINVKLWLELYWCLLSFPRNLKIIRNKTHTNWIQELGSGIIMFFYVYVFGVILTKKNKGILGNNQLYYVIITFFYPSTPFMSL